jgi:hypothetical protein
LKKIFLSELKKNLGKALVLVLGIVASSMAMAESLPLSMNIKIFDKAGPLAGCPSNFGSQMQGLTHSSELGFQNMTAKDCITPVQNAYLLSQGQIVANTNNGDTLTMTYSGSLIPIPDSHYAKVDAQYQITGGTGIFEGATGSGTIQGLENLLTMIGSVKLNGTINLIKP